MFQLTATTILVMILTSFQTQRLNDAISAPESCGITASLSRMPGMAEASGIAVSRRAPGTLWLIVDSGLPVLYAIDATSAGIAGRVQVAGAGLQDWEDISAGPCPAGTCLYIADIGDNRAIRSYVTVYRVPEPDAKAAVTQTAEAFHASYPDGPQDAEALFVTPQGQMIVVTKGETGPIAFYRFPSDARAGVRSRLERLSGLPVAKSTGGDGGVRVTDAESSPNGQWVAVRTHDAVLFYRMSAVLSGAASDPVRTDIRTLREPQGEGIAIGSSGEVYLVGESAGVGTFARLACGFLR